MAITITASAEEICTAHGHDFHDGDRECDRCGYIQPDGNCWDCTRESDPTLCFEDGREFCEGCWETRTFDPEAGQPDTIKEAMGWA